MGLLIAWAACMAGLIHALSLAPATSSWIIWMAATTLIGAALSYLVWRRPPSKSLWVACFGIGMLARVLVPIFGQADALSDDLFRYLFEGHVVVESRSPFKTAPDSPLLDELSDQQGLAQVRDHINHPQIATVYPPLAQVLFGVAALIDRGLGGHTKAWQFCALAFELAILAALWVGLQAATPGRGRAWFLAYLLSPLPIVEFLLSAHVDVAAVAFLLWAILAQKSQRFHWMWIAICASIFVKVLAIFVLPFFICRNSLKPALVVFAAAGIIATAFAYAWLRPYAGEIKLPTAAEVSIQDSPQWDDLLGRYYVINRPEDGAQLPSPLNFDGRGQLFQDTGFQLWSQRELGYYEMSSDGEFVLSLHADPERKTRVRLSRNRQYLLQVEASITGSNDLPEETRLIAYKRDESPFMGVRQYSGRWSANAPFFRQMSRDENVIRAREKRESLQSWIAILVFLLAVFLAWRGVETLAGITTVLAVLMLAAPVIYPWYLAWLLPLALMKRRPALLVMLALCPLLYLNSSDLNAGPQPIEIIVFGIPLTLAILGMAFRLWQQRSYR